MEFRNVVFKNTVQYIVSLLNIAESLSLKLSESTLFHRDLLHSVSEINSLGSRLGDYLHLNESIKTVWSDPEIKNALKAKSEINIIETGT